MSAIFTLVCATCGERVVWHRDRYVHVSRKLGGQAERHPVVVRSVRS